MTETVGAAFDFIVCRRGFIGGVVGTEDFDMARMHEAVEIVVFDLGSRDATKEHVAYLRTTMDLRMAEVVRRIAPSTELVLGSGKAPKGINLPIMYRALAPREFRLTPIQVAELMIDLIEADDWDHAPELKESPRGRGAPASSPKGEAGEAGERGEAGRIKRLPKARRMVFDREVSYTPPSFKVPVGGYDRRIKPTSWGKDKHGNPMLGWTWVRDHERHADKPDRPANDEEPHPQAVNA
jgi:hypothetical protein